MANVATPPQEHFLTFKFLKNVHIDLGDDSLHQPRMYFVEIMTNAGPASVDQYDMEIPQKVHLRDETPMIPVKSATMPERFYQNKVSAAYEKVDQAREFNDKVRSRVDLYVANGIIEILSDPFRGDVEADGFVERYVEDVAPASVAKKPAAKKRAVKKPAAKKPAVKKAPAKKKVVKKKPAAKKAAPKTPAVPATE